MPNPEAGRAITVGAFNPQPAGACFQCHGVNGAGDAAAAFPRLAGQSQQYLYESLKLYAEGIRESDIMEPIASALSDQEMHDVAAYYAALPNVPYPPTTDTADSALLVAGAALAAVGTAAGGVQGCVNCHGPQGAGLPPTYPYLGGQHRNYLEAQLLAWKAGTRGGDEFDIMANIARRLTDEEISAVAAYYASLRPVPVTSGPGTAAQLPPEQTEGEK